MTAIIEYRTACTANLVLAARRKPRRGGDHENRMSSPMLLVYTVMVLLIAYRLAAMYLGGGYVCPRCGARSADRHATDCPWSH
jgi:hypothetical protein